MYYDVAVCLLFLPLAARHCLPKIPLAVQSQASLECAEEIARMHFSIFRMITAFHGPPDQRLTVIWVAGKQIEENGGQSPGLEDRIEQGDDESRSE